MPTVLRADGFTVRIYGPAREHGPPHVHVERGNEEVAVIRLGMRGSPLKVWRIYGMRDQDVRRALDLVARHEDVLLDAWRRIHGRT